MLEGTLDLSATGLHSIAIFDPPPITENRNIANMNIKTATGNIIFFLIVIILCPCRLDIKKRGNRSSSVPLSEALALPDTVEQTTLEPTPI